MVVSLHVGVGVKGAPGPSRGPTLWRTWLLGPILQPPMRPLVANLASLSLARGPQMSNKVEVPDKDIGGHPPPAPRNIIAAAIPMASCVRPR